MLETAMNVKLLIVSKTIKKASVTAVNQSDVKQLDQTPRPKHLLGLTWEP